jgi:hypothetical protein
MGDGALSLIGLISSGSGLVGDPGCPTGPGRLSFFHFVEVTEVLIGEGFRGLCFGEVVENGVRPSLGLGASGRLYCGGIGGW